MDRRTFLAGALGLAHWREKSTKTRLILLGTGGGPRPRKASSGSSQVIVANGTPYVVDCGDGVARQLVFADIPLATLRHIFITHQHSDHTADYGNLIWLAWTAGLRTRVDTWGPPPLARMTKLLFRDERRRRRRANRDRGTGAARAPGPRSSQGIRPATAECSPPRPTCSCTHRCSSTSGQSRPSA
jgi:glyoxylase-like metal-dependent hydrolase (beta-lactamase superfamily II)